YSPGDGVCVAAPPPCAMTGDILDQAVRYFLEQHIATEVDLQVLLALMEGGRRWWDADALASIMGVPSAVARRSLESLTAKNLLDIRVSDAIRYQLQPGSSSLESGINRFAAAYRRSPSAILRWGESLVAGRPRSASIARPVSRRPT